MRTIEKISRYDLSKTDIFKLKKEWKINWWGWKGWVNFSKIIENNLKNFHNFNDKKLIKLWKDIQVLCFEHDLDYFYKKWFYLSNFIFARWIARLIKNWANIFERFLIFFITFHLLNKFGRKYYDK